MIRVAPGQKRINFDVSEELWERGSVMRYGMRSQLLRNLYERVLADAEEKGREVFTDVFNGEFEIRYTGVGDKPE
ncbi:MAG: hypothetical protein ACR2RF_25335 [Geminicoccaceae bacterium]